jgi:hypothetical protein
MNAEILSLCWTEVPLFNRNVYKSEVKSCAEEESEDDIQLIMNKIVEKIANPNK